MVRPASRGDSLGDIQDIQLHRGQFDAWMNPARFKILAAGRRWGKTEFGCWTSLERARRDRIKGVDPSIGWVIAPTYKVARPIWRKFLRLAPPGWITKINGTERTPDTLELGHARIEFKTADRPENLVAEGLRWVWIDEAGIVDERVWKESIRPALIDYEAPALISGTPKGHNWFHRLWARGNDPEYLNFKSFGGPSFENPFIPEGELEELIRDMIPRLIRQEIFAEFLKDTEGAVFRNIEAAIKKALSLFPDSGGYCNHPTYCIGIDLARLVDFTVLFGVCRQGHPTGFQRFKDVHWPLQKARILDAYLECDKPLLVVDASGIGDVVYQDLVAAGCKVSAVKTGSSKVQLVDALSIALDGLEILVPDEQVIVDELIDFGYEYTAHGNIRYGASEDMHDDCVIAVALAAYGLLNAPPPARLWTMSR